MTDTDDASGGGGLEYCEAFECPMRTTPLTPANSMWVHPRDNSPDETGFVGSKPVLDERWHMHTACFDAALHSPA